LASNAQSCLKLTPFSSLGMFLPSHVVISSNAGMGPTALPVSLSFVAACACEMPPRPRSCRG
jgi:hypothetical protein